MSGLIDFNAGTLSYFFSVHFFSSLQLLLVVHGSKDRAIIIEKESEREIERKRE